MRSSIAHLAVVVTTVILVTVPGARADYEETERRLKAIGVDEPTRAAIRDAINRGATWLLARQYEDGHWAGGLPPTLAAELDLPDGAVNSLDIGTTVLVALALRHTGTPAARASVRRARVYLFRDLRRRKETLSKTYPAGLAAMLVMADGDEAGLAEDLARRLVRGETSYGWWGYSTDAAGAGQPVNLSTTQFGALGLWAAARSGGTVPDHAWRRLAQGHATRQGPSGGWAYLPKDRLGKYAAEQYPQGTFMGLANLILGAAGAGDAAVPTLRRRIESARKKGLEALVRDGQVFLKRFAEPDTRAGPPRFHLWTYYSLYALEKACLFAGLEKLGDVPWYLTGARALLARQREDGSWPKSAWEPAEQTTAFALLFLLRASQAYHPITPSPVDGPPPAVITPSEQDR